MANTWIQAASLSLDFSLALACPKGYVTGCQSFWG